MPKFFEGWYLKHQKDGKTLALIPGRTKEHAFIQVVTDERAYQIEYPLDAYKRSNGIQIGENRFSCVGMKLNIKTEEITLIGKIRYYDITPIESDIMGPFQFLPMECSHTVVSMQHKLDGRLFLNGEIWDFRDGKGYIEGDRGRSFPSHYCWVQSNAFSEDCSVMVSIARIPFAGIKFWGCICVIHYQGKEYRLATYHSVKIQCMRRDKIILRQKDLLLVIEPEVKEETGQRLAAPQGGEMSRFIHEVPTGKARFFFADGENVLFDLKSDAASFEFDL